MIRFILLFLAFSASSAEWVTTIDGYIYITPVPPDCEGCAVEFVKVHTDDKWVQLRTDRISKHGFD